MKQFFISSTYNDLINERDKAIETIDHLDSSKAIAMERISAKPNPSKEVCLSELRKCNAVILILGYRYGSVDPDEKISVTEIEYNEAKSLQLPVFVFRKVNSDNEWIPEEKTNRIKKQLENFKKRLDSEQYRVSFQNSEELGRKIAIAIYNYESENGEIGIRNPQFVSGETFFRLFLDHQNFFNHCHPFYGRAQFLESLCDHIGSKKHVLILYGRGGIGKSRLLYELYKKFLDNPDHKFWFLRDSAQITDESLRQIPLKKRNIIVIDDAHRQNDLTPLINFAADHKENIQLLLSMRNYGLDLIKNQIIQSGFNPNHLEVFPELTELSVEEMENLADSILDSDHKRYSQALVQVARDSPLVLVIGARLINENNISPALLERNPDFQDIVFGKFQEIQMGELSPTIDKNTAKKILNLISAIQPVDLNDTKILDTISDFLKIDKPTLIQVISELERLGVFIKKRNSIRITPDLFSDYLLSKVCISGGRLTGYAESVFNTFFSCCPNEVISNIAELDWRVRNDGQKIKVMDQIWEQLFKEFHEGSNFARWILLDTIEKIAYHQPSRTLELIKYALSNPSSINQNFSGLHNYTHEDIKIKIPKILQKISYNIDYISQCAEILWDLGKDRDGLLASDTSHPIRILQELASYEYQKPLLIQRKILDSVEKWMKQPSTFNHVFSPLDIIDPMLRKDGEETRRKGRILQFAPFAISYKNTKSIRKRALSLISSATADKSTGVILRGLKSLEEALRPPRALFGRTISEKEYSQWHSEEREILRIIEKISNKSQDPIVQIYIIQQLRWYTKFQREKDLQSNAKVIVKKVKNSFEIRLNRALLYNYNDEDKIDYLKQQEIIEKRIQKAVIEFKTKFPSSDEAYSQLNQRLQKFSDEKIPNNPGRFIINLGKQFPEYSGKVCLKVLSQPTSSLSIHYSAILSGIKEVDKEGAKDLIIKGLNSKNKLVIQAIAFGYSNGWWSAGVEKDEIKNIELLLKKHDENLKKHAIASLAEFSKLFPQKIKKIALNLDIGNNYSYADALLKLFFSTQTRPQIELTRQETRNIIMKLKHIDSLDHRSNGEGMYICWFFKYACEKNPDSVIELFFERINLAKDKRGGDLLNRFDPIPFKFSPHCLESFHTHPRRNKLLKNVRDMALKTKNIFFVREIFSILSKNYEINLLSFFRDWIKSGDCTKLNTICELLHDCPPEHLYNDHQFIHKMLEGALAIDEECSIKIKKKLLAVGRYAGRSGTVGEPYPLDVNIRKIGEEALKKYPDGSITNQFYLDLTTVAAKWMDESRIDDEYRFDE